MELLRLFKLRTWIAMPIAAAIPAYAWERLHVSEAVLFVVMLFAGFLVTLTDPVGFGLREDPEVRRRRERSA